MIFHIGYSIRQVHQMVAFHPFFLRIIVPRQIDDQLREPREQHRLIPLQLAMILLNHDRNQRFHILQTGNGKRQLAGIGVNIALVWFQDKQCLKPV